MLDANHLLVTKTGWPVYSFAKKYLKNLQNSGKGYYGQTRPRLTFIRVRARFKKKKISEEMKRNCPRSKGYHLIC